MCYDCEEGQVGHETTEVASVMGKAGRGQSLRYVQLPSCAQQRQIRSQQSAVTAAAGGA